MEIEKKELYTVKEIAKILGVADRTIRNWIIKYYPNKMQNGKMTYLNQEEITIIKQEMNKNYSLESGFQVETDLERKQIIFKAIKYLQEDIEKLQSENKKLESKIQILIHDSKIYTTTELAKEVNFKSAYELNKELEKKEIQYKINNTWVLYAKYSDCNYVSIKQQELDNGKIIYNRHWTGQGRQFVLNLFNKGEKT